jgi:hypothetical protein
MTSTELERTTDVHDRTLSLPGKMEYAKTLAVSSLLPKAYQRQPANVLLALELGEALGIPPIQAINGIHIIEGKPTASAELIASVVRRAGHKIRVTTDAVKLVVVAQLIRADDPDFTYEARWDMERAKTAGLAGKGNWRTHPAQMLTWRAITEVSRMGASDALYGVSHTPDEISFSVPTADQQATRVTAAAILGEEVLDAEVVEAEPEPDPTTGEVPLPAAEPWSDEDLKKDKP